MTVTGKILRGRYSRFLTKAPLVISKHLWIWPLLGAVLISLVGVWTKSLVEGTTKAELASRLQTLLNADVEALKLWFSEQEADARSFAADIRIQQAIVDLAGLADDPGANSASLADSESAKMLALYLKPLLEGQNYLGYLVIASDRRVLASSENNGVGQSAPATYEPFLRRALGGRAVISRPLLGGTFGKGPEVPVMFSVAPVSSKDGRIVAVLGLRMKPEDEFSRILGVAKMGETGESYAFDARGIMLTTSRFEPDLRAVGLLPKDSESSSILRIRLADPGVDLQRMRSLPTNIMTRPLTRMAGSAVKGNDGYDVEGYWNYRGQQVIGAWMWLRDYGLGIATEVGTEEAFQTLFVLRRVFLTLFMLLVTTGLAIFAFSLLVERLQASIRKDALTERRLGQYVLVQEIGHGANGMVYKARHTLLRRPVAVKVLSPDLTNEANVTRFEHEVQMTSQLTHPNTVAIYDYGRTPEGLFYYAMEYLSGIDLHRLVREFAAQPEGRVIHILRQVCGSLAEAHRIGLIHRDIKPANILLTRRGGVCDLVKVLDFGMVKAVHLGEKGLAANSVVGTPHFMSPETIERPESVDSRSDLYALGAVGYWLLSGKTLFEGDTADDLMEKQVSEEPQVISIRLGRRRSPDLQAVIMRCLSKNPEDRPASAHELDEALAQCVSAANWAPTDAEKWWQSHVIKDEPVPAAVMPEKTLVIAPRA